MNCARERENCFSVERVFVNIVDLYSIIGLCKLVPRAACCVKLVERNNALLAVKERTICFPWEPHIDGVDVGAFGKISCRIEELFV